MFSCAEIFIFILKSLKLKSTFFSIGHLQILKLLKKFYSFSKISFITFQEMKKARFENKILPSLTPAWAGLPILCKINCMKSNLGGFFWLMVFFSSYLLLYLAIYKTGIFSKSFAYGGGFSLLTKNKNCSEEHSSPGKSSPILENFSSNFDLCFKY